MPQEPDKTIGSVPFLEDREFKWWKLEQKSETHDERFNKHQRWFGYYRRFSCRKNREWFQWNRIKCKSLLPNNQRIALCFFEIIWLSKNVRVKEYYSAIARTRISFIKRVRRYPERLKFNY